MAFNEWAILTEGLSIPGKNEELLTEGFGWIPATVQEIFTIAITRIKTSSVGLALNKISSAAITRIKKVNAILQGKWKE